MITKVSLTKKRPLWSKYRAYALLLLPPLFWAGNVVLARGMTQLIPPVAFAFWRWLLAFLFVLPFTWRHVWADRAVVRQHWGLLMLLGILGISSFNTLLYLGVQTTTAINGAVLQTAMPAIIVVLSLLLFRERISWLQAGAVLLSIGGAVLVVVRGDWQALRHFSFVIGDVQIFVAVVLYGLYSVLLRQRPLLHPLSFLATTFGFGVLCLLPLYLWERSGGAVVVWQSSTVLSVLYVAIFPSILAYLAWNFGLGEIGANRGGLFINFVPLFAAVLSVLFLGEPPQLYHLWGMLLIISGMVLFNRGR